MLKQDILGYEGPRTPRDAEWESIAELSRSIFFKDERSYHDAAVRWPMALHPDFRKHAFTMFYEGNPVSTIGRLERAIRVFGDPLRTGFVGGVCTHPDHRGKGLAGTILAASLKRFADNDVDFVYISGGRSLYLRAGANHVGASVSFVLQAGQLARLDTAGVSIRKAEPTDVQLLAQIGELDPTRVVRELRDYRLTVEHAHCCGRPAEFFIVQRGPAPVGCIFAGAPTVQEGRRYRQIFEYSGERQCIVSALAKLGAGMEPDEEVHIDTCHRDILAKLLAEEGFTGKPGKLGGTVKMLDFVRTMTKLKSYFTSHLPVDFVDSIELAAGGERYVAWSGDDMLEIQGESNLLWTFLGVPPGEHVANVRATGKMVQLLEECLPIPLPALHINVI